MLLKCVLQLIKLLLAVAISLSDFVVANALLFKLITQRISRQAQTIDALQHELEHDPDLRVSLEIGDHAVLENGNCVVVANIAGNLHQSGRTLLIEAIVVLEKLAKLVHRLLFAYEAFIYHPRC